jgi:hypothetical protein
MFFAACVIGFDSYYIVYPTTCFFSSSVCNSSGSNRGVFYSNDNFNNIKMSLIKGQLAAGAVMFVLCTIYVVVYIITIIRVHRAKQPPTVYPQVQNSFPPLSQVPNGVLSAPPANSYYPPMTVNNGDGRITQVVCPTCTATMNMTVRKQLPV